MKEQGIEMNFDTHENIKAFKAVGIAEEQAEAIVTAILKSRNNDISKLVTKDEFRDVLGKINARFDQIEKTMATKEDISKIRLLIADETAGMKLLISDQNAEMKLSFSEETAKIKLLISEQNASQKTWFLSFLLTFLGILAAVIIKFT